MHVVLSVYGWVEGARASSESMARIKFSGVKGMLRTRTPMASKMA
jgi:hypothetical protein